MAIARFHRPVDLGASTAGARVLVASALFLAVLSGIAGCGGDAGTAPKPPAREPPVPTSIGIEPASATLSWIGDTERFTATIRDQSGNPLAGTVVWSSGDQSVVAVKEDGEATAVAEGTTVVRATFRGLTASADVTVEQVPAAIEMVSGDGQNGLTGTRLAEPIVVMVADSGGHAVNARTVAFTPAAGNGTVTLDTATTNAGGLASTEWTLGEREGRAVAAHHVSRRLGRGHGHGPGLGSASVPLHGDRDSSPGHDGAPADP